VARSREHVAVSTGKLNKTGMRQIIRCSNAELRNLIFPCAIQRSILSNDARLKSARSIRQDIGAGIDCPEGAERFCLSSKSAVRSICRARAEVLTDEVADERK
jgi:hypothetical protein